MVCQHILHRNNEWYTQTFCAEINNGILIHLPHKTTILSTRQDHQNSHTKHFTSWYFKVPLQVRSFSITSFCCQYVINLYFCVQLHQAGFMWQIFKEHNFVLNIVVYWLRFMLQISTWWPVILILICCSFPFRKIMGRYLKMSHICILPSLFIIIVSLDRVWCC